MEYLGYPYVTESYSQVQKAPLWNISSVAFRARTDEVKYSATPKKPIQK